MATVKRKALSIETKVRILAEVDRNVRSKAEIAKEFGLSSSTLSTILKNREKVISADKCGLSRKRKRARDAKFPELEKALVEWVKKMRNANAPVDGKLLRSQAETFSLQMDISETDFHISDGWLQRFKDRNNLVFRKLCGEGASVNKADSTSWKEGRLKDLLQKYPPEDIYNADETGLMYKLLPDRSLVFKTETASGGKRAKQRITVLLAANMTGTDKLPPLIIGQFKKPRCFKGLKTLPLEYRNNRKAWMTSVIFEDWLRNLDLQMTVKKRKILLIVDNCSAHPIVENLRSIDLEFLPPNMTSMVQPLDQGVILCLKKNYRRMLLNRVALAIECDQEYSVSVLSAMHWVQAAWKLVTPETITNCFRHAGFGSAVGVLAAEESTEGDILIQRLRDRNVPVPDDLTFAQYSSVDESVQCAEEKTDEDILSDVCRGSTAEEEDECEEDEVEVARPNVKQAVEAALVLSRFFESQEDSARFLQMISEIESGVLASVPSKQSLITDFFKQ